MAEFDKEHDASSNSFCDFTPINRKNVAAVMNKFEPGGSPSISQDIAKICRSIRLISEHLDRDSNMAHITIATDCAPRDEDGNGGDAVNQAFVESLRSLENLPVRLVIRLCTSEEEVVEFYNSLVSLHNLPIDVLQDFVSEAKKVRHINKWLNYGIGLHRCRQLGFRDHYFDLLTQRQLTVEELKYFCSHLFDEKSIEGIDTSLNFNKFWKRVKEIVEHERNPMDPVRGKLQPWIDLRTVTELYSHDDGCFVM